MSLLVQRSGSSGPLPRLAGRELLIGANPDVAKVRGVMFGGRKQFILDTAGEGRFFSILEKLSPRTAGYTRTPLATSWCEFESLIELDRTIYQEMKSQQPNVLAAIGAASAELGIGRVYRSLDTIELAKFFEKTATFHSQYVKFGSVRFERTVRGGRMTYSDYPCYSPIFCASAVGYFMESILRHGGVAPHVIETKCQTLGNTTCTFEMTWT